MIFSQILHYFSVYKKYIGRRLYIVFILTALAAITEGFGIAMLLPLIDAAGVGLGGEGMEQSGVKAALQGVLDWLGIGTSMVGILLFIACVFLFKGLIIFSAGAYQSHLKSQLMREMKALMFDKYSTMTYGYYTRRSTGHFINVLNGQISGLIGSFSNYKKFLCTIITTSAYFGMAFFLSWHFALMAVVAGGVLLFLFRGLNNYVHNLSRKAANEATTLNKFIVQAMQSFKYLASTAQMGYIRTGVMQSIHRLTAYMRNKDIAQDLTTALNEPVAIFFILMVIVIQVAVLDASLAPIFVALILFNRAIGGVLNIQKSWQSTLSNIGSLEVVEKEFKALEEFQEDAGTIQLKPLAQGIELSHVSFAYGKGSDDVLKDIALTIPANATVAFVGESGAGKSTLVDMLTLMLRPRGGELLIDGISSSKVNLASWRSQIGYVSQETVVFDDTIANNISLWKDDYNQDPKARERIELAAKQAYAEKFIQDLPDQFNTFVGDRGVRLSGGQRQRLFLARELYKNPRLLILDEATSALDSESEKYIQESIEALRGRTTVVIIAHRLSTIKNADYIYVLDKGKIIEQGSFNQLLSTNNGRFNRMVALQSL
ncbi:ABC transporter ATP-binding protein [Desulfonatronum thiodismutans]|uniref:ABC transporter ATP-binding protein n=1 Tax=Desulfonatronum thiodismutans TaxID=159290 RepID=UPI0004ABD58D|nr:ABC transporter ATP-binding protein [Desulfonatronum thiodismutans]